MRSRVVASARNGKGGDSGPPWGPVATDVAMLGTAVRNVLCRVGLGACAMSAGEAVCSSRPCVGQHVCSFGCSQRLCICWQHARAPGLMAAKETAACTGAPVSNRQSSASMLATDRMAAIYA